MPLCRTPIKADDGPRTWVRDDLLPVSSRNVHIIGELSPSREWCAFEFSPADSGNLPKKLKAIDALPPSVSHVPSPGVSWWPAALSGNLDASKIRKAGLELYIVEEPANSVSMSILLFAIDWQTGRGYFFDTYKPDSAPPSKS